MLARTLTTTTLHLHRPSLARCYAVTPAFNQPMSGNEMPRYAGPGTFMRLPTVEMSELASVDVAVVGCPLDQGTSNRSGTRFGPRAIRGESALLRPVNMATGATPFDSIQVADAGDVAANPYHLPKALDDITTFYKKVVPHTIPLSLGGDHTLTLPVLRAVAETHGPVGLIHIDAHLDCNEKMFEEPYAHGTTFYHASKEGLLDNSRVVQIGIRGTGYGADDMAFGRENFGRIYEVEELWGKSLTPLAQEVRELVGDKPVYVSFDIDSLDPAFAPGTGTPEIGGLTTPQALQLVRGLRGLNNVGCDVVEVCPPYDSSGNTALVAANIAFELLCVLPGVKYAPK